MLLTSLTTTNTAIRWPYTTQQIAAAHGTTFTIRAE
jgi:hypothetical protein